MTHLLSSWMDSAESKIVGGSEFKNGIKKTLSGT